MTAERILQSDVLDILFENRNKHYGAYELRRNYPSRVKRAVGGMLLGITIVSAGYLFGSKANVAIAVDPDYFDSAMLIKVDPLEQPKEPETPKPAAVQEVATVKNNIPLIVPNEQVTQTEIPPIEQIDSSAYGDKTQSGQAATDGRDVVGTDAGSPGGNGDGDKPVAAPEPVMPSGPIDMHQADEMPEYPGGTQALVRYMVNNLTSELEPGNKYVLKAQFVIDKTGQVSDATILSSDDASLNNQVLKALRKMKQWKPGKFHGRNVAVRFTMPVTFVGPEE